MTHAPSDVATKLEQATALVPACPNCGEVANARARFCGGCGQRRGTNLLTVKAFVAEVLEESLSLDGRLPRTMRALLLRPGHLTREYTAGRIARYVRPFRLYLVSSVIFFLTLSMTIRFGSDRAIAAAEGAEELAGDQPVSEAPAAETPVPDPGAAANAPPPDSIGTDPAEADQPRAAAAQPQKGVSKPNNRLERMVYPFVQGVTEDPANAIRRLTERLLRDVPKAVVILLPVFAIFLKLLYIRRRRLYVEHLVFILHVHAFAFLLATPLILLPDRWPTGLVWLLIPAYIFWAMRRVYGQSIRRTALKLFIFSWLYTISIIATLVTVIVLAAVALGSTV